MIRAAVDARGSFPGLLIADDSTTPARLIFVGTLRLAEYTEEGAAAGRKRAYVTPERAHFCADLIFTVCRDNRVEKLAIETGGRSYTDEFVADVLDAFGDTASTVQTDWTEDTDPRGYFTHWPPGAREGEPWATGDYKGTRDAARVWIGGQVAPERAPGASTEPARVDPATALSITTGQGAPIGQRVLGVNPGAHVGICVGETLGGGFFKYIMSRTIDVDPSDEDERYSFITGLVSFMQELQIAKVIIKRMAGGIYGGGSDERSQAILRARTAILVQTNWLGGLVEGVCWTSPNDLDVETVSANVWRRRLLPGTAHAPNDYDVERLVRGRWAGWPAVSRPYERDAAGLVLWSALPPAPAAARPRKADGTAYTAGDESKARTAARRARNRAKVRTAKGCTCPPGHKGAHIAGCPVGRKAGSVQKCKVCGQPRRGHTCPGKIDIPQVINT